MDKAEIQNKLEKVREGLSQAEHQRVRLENRLAYLTKKSRNPMRDARTHRVANKGGTVEHFFPESKELSEEEFYGLMDQLCEVPGFRSLFEKEIARILNARESGEPCHSTTSM